MKISKPYFNCSINHISQPFGNPQSFGGTHTGVDLAPFGAYGTFLVAPEKVRIKQVITQETFAIKYLENLSKGFGVLMTSLADPNVDYLYWHCLSVIPVRVGDIVEQGEEVAQMGNTGFVLVGGKVVPIELRNSPPYPGTHLHFEVRVNNQYVNPVPLIDWDIPVKRTTLQWIAKVLTQITNFIKLR